MSTERPPLELAQFLKILGVVGSGGTAKVLIQGGEVQVNGAVETRRGRKLQPGDTVSYGGETWTVPANS